ncbi:GTPase ObgE, partial [bacterium]|nr:GTPase ObgE [bacterium]
MPVKNIVKSVRSKVKAIVGAKEALVKKAPVAKAAKKTPAKKAEAKEVVKKAQPAKLVV